MSFYNKWQNESIFGICDELTSEERTCNKGIFFDSIFKTLNHIILVHQIIHHFIQIKVLPDVDFKTIPYSSYEELKLARFTFDEKLVQASQLAAQAWLDEMFEFWSKRLKKHRRVPRGFYYIQMFNHQTHYRSQITSEFHKMGINYGSTGLPYNPYYDF
ncbi:MAG TPA: damage-inducible protein DinB [Leptolyngbyaceae cyanobacterium M33_DOE_097]|uniref:Damage-inducible protein DinB n=1 Tax=Oscillatoriales cyanobacterium SpSt-418 TaxID=2282169 RepID=A0A7C3PKM7_9CYAN|nr:damage-inducible protein DinB [Leptolyngbyaceae cyanobacterium M33_DOE_097]